MKVQWIGPNDEDGFVNNEKLYSIKRITATGHFEFINNFGKIDVKMQVETVTTNVVNLGEKIEKRSLDKFETAIALNKLNEAIEKLSCHSEISVVSDVLAMMESATLELQSDLSE